MKIGLENVMDDIALGAHLTSPRYGFMHHGIYVGNGRVIHYCGFDGRLRRGPIEIVPLDEFTRGCGLTVSMPAASRYAGSACVERARSRLGENRYRFWSNNCEHFVEWCFSGLSRSRQVEAFQSRLTGLVAWLTRPAARFTVFSAEMRQSAESARSHQ